MLSSFFYRSPDGIKAIMEVKSNSANQNGIQDNCSQPENLSTGINLSHGKSSQKEKEIEYSDIETKSISNNGNQVETSSINTTPSSKPKICSCIYELGYSKISEETINANIDPSQLKILKDLEDENREQ
jgi:hypothetical protein